MLKRNLSKIKQCRYLTLVVLLCQVALLSCEMDDDSYDDSNVNVAIARGLLQLTLSIDKTMSPSVGENTLYSPVSIANALALALLGARGVTFDELANVLGFASILGFQSNSQIVHERFGRLLKSLSVVKNYGQVNIGTALFVQNDYPIRDMYRRTAKRVYNSEILNLDFRTAGSNAMEKINNWVEEQTNGKIKKMLSEPPDTNTRVIIASALYFKGSWKMPFMDKKYTKRGEFYANGRDQPATSTPLMMTNTGMFPYYMDRTLNCEIMGFPYKGDAMTMYVVMPLQSDIVKLRQLQQDLTPAALERLVGKLKYETRAVVFPKMKLEATVDLSEALKRIGAKALFNPMEADLGLLSDGDEGAIPLPHNVSMQLIPSSAGFKGPTQPHSNAPNNIGKGIKRAQTLAHLLQRSAGSSGDNPGLYADKVLHKVYIEVTETGTIAAAVTLISLGRSAIPSTFRVNVPFLFFIRSHDTKLVLFWGAVIAPSS